MAPQAPQAPTAVCVSFFFDPGYPGTPKSWTCLKTERGNFSHDDPVADIVALEDE